MFTFFRTFFFVLKSSSKSLELKILIEIRFLYIKRKTCFKLADFFIFYFGEIPFNLREVGNYHRSFGLRIDVVLINRNNCRLLNVSRVVRALVIQFEKYPYLGELCKERYIIENFYVKIRYRIQEC